MEYKKKLNENFLHSSQNDESDNNGHSEEAKYRKIFGNYMMTQSGQLMPDNFQQPP